MRKGKEEFKFNPADYDYMDELPLEGWIWEFIRRNPEYRKLYADCEKIKPGEFKKALDKINEIIKKCAVRAIFRLSDQPINSEHFLLIDITLIPHFFCIPKPHIKYNQFREFKPIIIGITPVISHAVDISMVDKDGNLPKRVCKDIVNNILPPVDARNTLYVGIARTANKDNVREALESIVKYLIKPRDIKIKDEMWKDYLFIYDLKEKLDRIYKKITYKDFTKILTENCPSYKLIRDSDELKKQLKKLDEKNYKNPEKVFMRRYPSTKRIGGKTVENRKKLIFQVDSQEYFYEKHCERFYKKAQSLIKGEYKKYLYLK